MDERVQVYVSRKIPEAGLQILSAAGLEFSIGQENEDQSLDRQALFAGVQGCDVLLSLLTEAIDRPLLESAPALSGIASMAVGYDNIDLEAATELGIPVSNTPGVLTESTADLTFAMLLAVARRLPEAHEYMRDGRYRLWGPNLLVGADLGPGPEGRPKVLGIVGLGRIGAAVARRARGFRMRVLAYHPYDRDRVAAEDGIETVPDLRDLLSRSDFVTLHPRLSEKTHHLIAADELRAMKRSAYLINASRGPIADEAALVVALREGWIAGAALDVYEREPKMADGLAALPNVVLLPHIASATHDTRGRMASMAAQNAICHLRRERAPNALNPEVYELPAYRQRGR